MAQKLVALCLLLTNTEPEVRRHGCGAVRLDLWSRVLRSALWHSSVPQWQRRSCCLVCVDLLVRVVLVPYATVSPYTSTE